MSRDELLTKLAMEVGPSYWPPSDTEYEFGGFVFGWNEYQLRRTELINKPSWNDAPEWAQWRSQNQDGSWCWHELEPTSDHDGWIMFNPNNEKQVAACRGAIPAGHDWRKTLEPRPQTQSDIKNCRHCDITFNRPHVDGIPDDRCTRCDDEIKALWPEREPAKTWWTSKTCTKCGHTTAAKVSDDEPVCPDCVTLGPDISGGGPDVSSGQCAKAPCGSDIDACALSPCGQRHEGASLNQVLDDHIRMASEKWARGDMEARSKYHREIKPGVWVDVYDVLKAWGVKNPALQHLIKKALAPGERGHKTLEQDMADIVASARRAKELEE